MKYRIIRIIKLTYLPIWLIHLLYALDPSVYDECDTFEACLDKLYLIEKIINHTTVLFNRTMKPINKFKKIVRTRDCLSVIGPSNQVNVIFKIEHYD